MTDPRNPSAKARSTIAGLARPMRIDSHGPIAGRFIYSLRLIALHQRARRDPVPELAARLGSVEIAAKSLALAQAIGTIWPEDIHVSRFCCQFGTHDETTIASLLDAAANRDQSAFNAAIDGLVRPARIAILWEAVLELVAAEMHAA